MNSHQRANAMLYVTAMWVFCLIFILLDFCWINWPNWFSFEFVHNMLVITVGTNRLEKRRRKKYNQLNHSKWKFEFRRTETWTYYTECNHLQSISCIGGTFGESYVLKLYLNERWCFEIFHMIRIEWNLDLTSLKMI